jgi:DNA oxidative demethylase
MARKNDLVPSNQDLFGFDEVLIIKKDVVLLRQFASIYTDVIFESIKNISDISPFRHMKMPTGHSLSVATTSCGSFGWITDRLGYRYQKTDPETNQNWPAMPKIFEDLANEAAKKAGFPHFNPESCLINRYAPHAKLSLHQDKDEGDFNSPVVSISLGLPAIFLFGGKERKDPKQKIPLTHGDVIVWGGDQRLAFHGILPIKPGIHPIMGSFRYNLTFRKISVSSTD